jgi:hypothetical protein
MVSVLDTLVRNAIMKSAMKYISLVKDLKPELEAGKANDF